MIINHDSPGVYPITTDNSDYVASAVGTSVGVVGGATKGPLTKSVFTDISDLYKVHGYPVENDYGLRLAESVLKANGTVVFQRIIKRGLKATAGDKSSDPFIFTTKEGGTCTDTISVENVSGEGTSATFDVVLKRNKKEIEKFTSLNTDPSSPSNITRVLNSNSAYITATVIPENAIANKEYTLAGGTSGASYGVAGTKGTDNLIFTTKTYDSTLNGAIVELTEELSDGFFDFVITLGDTIVEKITSLSDDESDPRYFVDTINKYSEYVTVQYDKSVEATVTGKRLYIQNGTDGISGITTAEVIEGLRTFENAEDTDIRVLAAPGYTDIRVAKYGDSIASLRDDCEFIMDLPREVVKPQDCVDYVNGKGEWEGKHDAVGSKSSACYSPWMTVYDERLRKDVEVPPSVYVAAVYVTNDKEGYPWSAPAGLKRGKITTPVKLITRYSQSDRDILCGSRNCVNPIISYANEGIVVWGQKTMQRRSSSLDRIGVVRLMHYLKKSIKNTTAYFVFEGSRQTMWDQWVLAVESILEECKANGGIYDYRIKMNNSTTISAHDIENYIAPGVIQILPTKPAEIIPIDFQLYSGGISFKDAKFDNLAYSATDSTVLS